MQTDLRYKHEQKAYRDGGAEALGPKPRGRPRGSTGRKGPEPPHGWSMFVISFLICADVCTF